MKEITKLMMNEFHIKKLGYDFMGYHLQKREDYSFHHLIVPARFGGKYERSNGAVLNGKTSHPYIHIIEEKDFDRFSYITSEMVDMNIKGYLDTENLRRIDDVLNGFEREYSSATTRKGKMLIKDSFLHRRNLWK